jgi:hypothetical protein
MSSWGLVSLSQEWWRVPVKQSLTTLVLPVVFELESRISLQLGWCSDVLAIWGGLMFLILWVSLTKVEYVLNWSSGLEVSCVQTGKTWIESNLIAGYWAKYHTDLKVGCGNWYEKRKRDEKGEDCGLCSLTDDGGYGKKGEDEFLLLKSVVEFFIYYFCLHLFTSIYCLPTFVLVGTRFLYEGLAIVSLNGEPVWVN